MPGHGLGHDGHGQAGIDRLFVGPYYNLTLGIPGQVDDPRFLEAAMQVGASARSHGKWSGTQTC